MKDPTACYWALHLAPIFWVFIRLFKLTISPPEKLYKVSSVEYRLHRTFPQPIRTMKNRHKRFALGSAGWGTFTIYITVYLTDGTEINTAYDLDFTKSWPSDEQPMYTAEDLRLTAEDLRLTAEDLRLTAEDLRLSK